MFDRDLDEAEEQYQMALRNHLVHVDELIDLQNSRLRGLNEEFIRDTEIVKNEFDSDKEYIDMSHSQERQELLDMIETIKENEENKLNEMRNAFESTREETKNRNVEELETMKQDLIKKIEELDKSFEVAFNRFVSETNQKAALYEDLLTNNQKDSDQINMFQRQINRLKEQTTYLTMKINQNKKECDERNTRVKLERDSIVSHYH